MKGALDAGLVADQTIQFSSELIGFQGGVRAELDFLAPRAAEIPGGPDQLFEQGLLDAVLWFYAGLIVVPQFLEFLALIGSDDQVASGDRKSTRLNSSHVKISYAV